MKLSFGVVYNASVSAGLILVGCGVWQFSHGAALICVGALVLVLTVYAAERVARLRKAAD